MSEPVKGSLEEEWLYLLDETGNALALLPAAVCAQDDKTDRHDVFLPRIVGTKPGAKLELSGILSGSKRKHVLG